MQPISWSSQAPLMDEGTETVSSVAIKNEERVVHVFINQGSPEDALYATLTAPEKRPCGDGGCADSEPVFKTGRIPPLLISTTPSIRTPEGRMGDSDLSWALPSETSSRLVLHGAYETGVDCSQIAANTSKVVSIAWNSIPAIELLDAGAGGKLASLRKQLEAAEFRVTQEGKARARRKATEIFASKAARPFALELARTLKLNAEAVKPLDWEASADIVVAAAEK